MKKYGFLGIGIMGKAMAANLLKAGFTVTVWNRTPERCQPLVEMGAEQGTSPAEVIRNCDITFAMVSDPPAAEALCFGDNGVLAGMGPGKGYVDISTIDPKTTGKIASAVAAKGGRYLEAPVSGSKKPAEDGTLVFLCAGDASLYREAESALAVMGKKSFYFAETGQGAQMKLVVNMIMGSMMTAFAEGLSLADKLGLAKNEVLDVLAEGAMNNPMFQLKGPLMSAENFTPAFPLHHMQKDMRLALQLGEDCNQALPTACAANQSFIKAKSKGYGLEDFSVVLKTISE